MSEEIGLRKQGIRDCLEWLSQLDAKRGSEKWVSDMQANVQFEPDKSLGLEYGGIGVFCKKEIKKGQILMVIPKNAGITLNHDQFNTSPNMQSFVSECKEALISLIDRQTVSQFDRYEKVKGRVLLKSYLLLTFVITLMLYDKASSDGDDTVESLPLQLSEEATKVYQFWSSFLDTQPHDWSHLPLMWNAEDLAMIEGTSFGALAIRFQDEMNQVFQKVFVSSLVKHGMAQADASLKNENLLYFKYKQALAIVNSHSHSLDGQNYGRFNNTFVEPTPIIFPIIDLVNGMRDEVDCNAELVGNPIQGCYHLQATKDCQAGDEVFICYGENKLSNLDFFIKFGYIPLRDGCPVLVKDDFVTMPVGSSLRPKCEGETGSASKISNLDKLRWKELARNGLGKDRIVEPIQYFQRPMYLNGDLEAVRRLRNSHFGADAKVGMIDRLEQFVMTMLASQKALKKLSEGKVPPPPVLEGWEPGKEMIKIIDHYLEQCTTLSKTTSEHDIKAAKSQRGNEQLATHARIVERELLLVWRHGIATSHRLYSADAAKVDRLPRPSDGKACCIHCRTSLRVRPCAQCDSVYYCGESCRSLDWKNGHGRICAMIAKSKGLS